MITQGNAVSDALINNTITDNVVGLCYYDPIEEKLLELSKINDHLLTVDPMNTVIKKYFLLIKQGSSLKKIVLSLDEYSKDNSSRHYEVKVIVGDATPTVDDFKSIPEFNRFTITNYIEGHLIPVWICAKSKTNMGQLINMGIDIYYE